MWPEEMWVISYSEGDTVTCRTKAEAEEVADWWERVLGCPPESVEAWSADEVIGLNDTGGES